MAWRPYSPFQWARASHVFLVRLQKAQNLFRTLEDPVAKEAGMPHERWNLLWSFWATSLAWTIVALFTLAANSNAQEALQPYAPPILHTFLDSANVYPEKLYPLSNRRRELCHRHLQL